MSKLKQLTERFFGNKEMPSSGEWDEAKSLHEDGYREYPAELYGILSGKFSADPRVREFTPKQDQRSQVGKGHWVDVLFKVPGLESPPKDCVPYIHTVYRNGEIYFTVCAPDTVSFPEALSEKLVDAIKDRLESFRVRFGGEFRDPGMNSDPHKIKMTKVAVRVRLSPTERQLFVELVDASLEAIFPVVQMWEDAFLPFQELDSEFTAVRKKYERRFEQLLGRVGKCVE